MSPLDIEIAPGCMVRGEPPVHIATQEQLDDLSYSNLYIFSKNVEGYLCYWLAIHHLHDGGQISLWTANVDSTEETHKALWNVVLNRATMSRENGSLDISNNSKVFTLTPYSL